MNQSLNMTPARELIPAPASGEIFSARADELRNRIAEAMAAWLNKSTSTATRINYACDLQQFLTFVELDANEPEQLARIRPQHVSAWRDHLLGAGLTNHSVVRKLSTLRSLLEYAS